MFVKVGHCRAVAASVTGSQKMVVLLAMKSGVALAVEVHCSRPTVLTNQVPTKLFKQIQTTYESQSSNLHQH